MNNNKNSKPAAAPSAEPILKLSKEQEWAATLWETRDTEEIAAAVGVSPAVIREWETQPLFIAEIAQNELSAEYETKEKQAAALVFKNISYADAETAIRLKKGTILEWAQEEGSAFNELLDEMKGLVTSKLRGGATPYGLTEEQIQAIPLIIEGKSDAEVGEAIGKTRETVNRWRNHDHDFKRELEAARKSYLEAQVAAVSARAQKAIAVLDKLLDSDDERIRLQAASLLLKSAPALKEERRKSKSESTNALTALSSYLK